MSRLLSIDLADFPIANTNLSTSEAMNNSNKFLESGYGIIPTDREGKILKITSNCDHAKIFREFTQFVERNNHGAVMDRDADSRPIRPTDAFTRRELDNSAPGDDRLIDDFIKKNRYWTVSCNVVVPAFLSMLDKEMYEELVIVNVRDVNISTQENLFDMMQVVFMRYGGWNFNKGDRNYWDTMAIPNMTTRALVHSGLVAVKEKKSEREGWNNREQFYPDSFYKTWLLSRMKNWAVISHLMHTFEEDSDITFDEMCARLLAKMARERDEESSMSHKIREMAASNSISSDTSSFRYEGNHGAVKDPQYAFAATQLAGRSNTARKCYNCHQVGHMSSQCTQPRAAHRPPLQTSRNGVQSQSQFEAFQQFLKWQQGNRQTTVPESTLGKRPYDNGGREQLSSAPPPKKAYFKESYPMRGPGPAVPTQYRGATCINQDEPEQLDSQQLELFQQFQAFTAYTEDYAEPEYALEDNESGEA